MSNLIVKDNALIEASYTLDVVEQRLILLAILEAREQKQLIQAGSLLRIHASSYIHQFNVDKSTAYKALKEAVKGLYESGFAYSKADNATGKIGHYKSRWVDKIGYIDDLGCVELVFASDVIPLITRLEKRFTEYDIEQISGLQSRYAIRLYELLSQWRSVGKTPLFHIEDFRFKLGLGSNEYQIMGNFKKKVLDLALTQINEKTDIVASYEQHKAGRNITGFSFSFSPKHTKSDEDATPRKLSEKQVRLFANKLARYEPFASQKAAVGESYEDLEKRLMTELQDIQHVRKYASILKELGLDV